ncbi:hypothetical protein EJ110_NYTH08513 [Nymphaea thermarum]|nr:hypothetical protein EJ110_NYTH08513 [Nymphaea thermarum]
MAPISTSPCANPGIRRGAWSKEEDALLRRCIEKFGLKRCRKSCRLRWVNYLSPNIKRGIFLPEEDDLIIRMHRLLGNRFPFGDNFLSKNFKRLTTNLAESVKPPSH